MSTPPTTQPQTGERSFLAVLIGALFRLFFFITCKMFKFIGITVVWVVLAVLAQQAGTVPTIALTVLAAVVVFIALAPIKNQKLVRFATSISPIFGDKMRATTRKEKATGRDYAEWFGFAAPDATHLLNPRAAVQPNGFIVWTFSGLGVGWDAQRVSTVIESNLHLVNARAVEISNVRVNSYKVVFITTAPPELPPFQYVADTPQPNAPNTVCIGVRQVFSVETGYTLAPALMPLRGVHTLLVGTSGAGKGSVLWSMVLGLKNQLEDGSVQIWGIDLKGGMEIGFGAALFTRTAYNVADAETMVDDMIAGLEERKTQQMNARSRSHVPTPENPLVLLVIDEANGFQQTMESKPLGVIMGKIKMILAQGRAAGYLVFACLQDPTKEAFPARNGFTRQIVLRMRSEDETQLALARNVVPPAHLIPPSTPGVGYSCDTETGETYQFRAFHVTDDDLDQAIADHREKTH